MTELNPAAVERSQGKPKRKARWESWVVYVLREAHFWIGLVLCIPFVLLGISGSYLTYHDEIGALFSTEPSFEAVPGNPYGVEAIVGAAEAAAGPGLKASMISLPRQEGEAAIVRVGPPGASFRDPRTRSLAIGPADLDVLGEIPAGANTVERFMHVLHGSLMIQGIGRPIVGWLGVGMLLLGISGLILWWPRPGQWKQALTIKTRAKGYRFQRDLHGVIGFWTLIVFVIVSFTGVYISFPQAMSAATAFLTGAQASAQAGGPPRGPAAGGAPGQTQSQPPAMASLGALAAAAQRAVPDGDITHVMLPFRPGMGARVSLRYPGMWDGAPSIAVTLNPASGAVTEVRDPRNDTPDKVFQSWQRPLHQGDGWGPVWRFLVFVSGFLPLLFSITGVSMWLIKRRNRRRMQAG